MGKKVSKIIPKEIKPAVPFIAAAFGAPYLAGSSFMTSAVSNPFVRNLIAKGITSAATTKAIGGDTKQALRSGILSVAPDIAGAGLEKFAGADLVKYGPQAQGSFSGAVKGAQELASKGASALQPETFMGKAKLIGGQTAIEAGARAVELNEKALRDYEAQLREQGIMDSAERRNKIFGYFTNAGYSADETNAMLDKYGYANGGRVRLEGGGLADLLEYLKEKEDEDEFRIGDLTSAVSGFETAFGKPMMETPQPMGINPGFGNMPRMRLAEGGIPSAMAMRKTIAELIASGVIDEEDVEQAIAEIKNKAMMSMRAPGMADGGMMNLKMGGMPAEMDFRGGGFVPIGKERRADDVPARLSKDEFVMTARAVDGAGKALTGNKKNGPKIMYDLMNKFEAIS